MINEFVPLADLTTMRVGGTARYFFIIKNEADVISAYSFAKENGTSFFVLGGGSNTVISDDGFAGVVMKMEMKGVHFSDEHDGAVIAVAEAGENWDTFVAMTIEHGLYGLENLSAIPGTVGAAPIQNIGAYGIEVSDTIAWVEALDPVTMSTHRFRARECHFGYRDSFFKTAEGRELIVLRAAFSLKRNGDLRIGHDDIKKYFSERKLPIELSAIRQAITDIRSAKLPDLRNIGTAGSFFKNPVISRSKADELCVRYPGALCFPVDDKNVKISAAWLIDHVGGWKGYHEGGIGVYEKHALVLVNYGTGTAAELISLAEKIIADVKNKTGIALVPEVCIV